MFATVAAAAAALSGVHWGAQSLRHCPGFPTQVNPTASWRRPVVGWSGIEKCHICAVWSLPTTARLCRHKDEGLWPFIIRFFFFTFGGRKEGKAACCDRPTTKWVVGGCSPPTGRLLASLLAPKSSPPFLAAATVEIKGRRDLKSWKADY